MSAEVDWVLSEFGDVVDAVAREYGVDLIRVDRDDSRVYDGHESIEGSDSVRRSRGELQRGVFVGAASADVESTPTGVKFDVRTESTVNVRVQGLHHSEYGHVDPAGEDGVPFDELVRRLGDALLDERTSPQSAGEDTDYHTLYIDRFASFSNRYADYYRSDFSPRFVGYTELP